MKAFSLIVAMALGSVSLSALADWQLSAADSRLWFGSVKNQSIGETHHLRGLTGAIDESGKVTIEAVTGSLDTGIEIRDERMLEHLMTADSFIISAQVDTASFDALDVGETQTALIPVTVSLGVASTEQEAQVLVGKAHRYALAGGIGSAGVAKRGIVGTRGRHRRLAGNRRPLGHRSDLPGGLSPDVRGALMFKAP